MQKLSGPTHAAGRLPDGSAEGPPASDAAAASAPIAVSPFASGIGAIGAIDCTPPASRTSCATCIRIGDCARAGIAPLAIALAATSATIHPSVFMFHSFRSRRDDVLHPYDDGAWPFIPAPHDRRARRGAAPFLRCGARPLSFIRQPA
ncbi:hypothetical protein [Burkholderia multivorans]|uniref:hypothetical protein n=1 Tax=Burkholderia multivorans TaxID=87883 RepID=UPI001592760C|nr:hypothetical protein [Burkholderia multivorans]MBU9582427.1 hypothetical protein [Burkholderia multivorans]MBU9666871.1 hypothetical protein [Burkholderia multivorans]UQO69448.1 hypothetical protein L0Z19_17725 [Burkholderia multivorans]HEF4754714.1 hypothetical protein [Burkholderia multivorans]HEM7808759.1 hypothetical protein [Burkholderia multivorans]